MGRGLEGKENFPQQKRRSPLSQEERVAKRELDQQSLEIFRVKKEREVRPSKSSPLQPSQLLKEERNSSRIKVKATTLFSTSTPKGGQGGLINRAAQFIEKLGDANEGRLKKTARATAVVLGISSVSLGVGALSLGASGFFGVGAALVTTAGIATAALFGAAFYLRRRRRP